jgi:hypothetical protein
MIKYMGRDFLSDKINYSEGVIVVEVNLQGLWETETLIQLKKEFPKSYRFYQRMCVLKRYEVGSVVLFEEDGYKIAFLITKDHRKLNATDTYNNFTIAINNLFTIIPEDVTMFSGQLGQEDFLFIKYYQHIRTKIKNRVWFLYKKRSTVC